MTFLVRNIAVIGGLMNFYVTINSDFLQLIDKTRPDFPYIHVLSNPIGILLIKVIINIRA